MRPEIRQDGVVLVMVLIVLVALMLIGVGVMRTTNTETRIAGNELRYQRDFYLAEGASDFVVAEFDKIMYDLPLAEKVLTSLHDAMRASDIGIPSDSSVLSPDVSIILERTGLPLLGSGTSVVYTNTNYYRLSSVSNAQSIDVGLWKSYPKPQ